MATAPHAIVALPQLSRAVYEWVESVRQLTQPARVHWCEGSAGEIRDLTGRPYKLADGQPLRSLFG